MTPTPTAPPAPSPPPGVPAWRILLRMFSGVASLFLFAYWAAAGANRGWTKNQIAEKQIDEVPGIEFLVYKDHFMPGIEFLGLGFFLLIVLFAISFIGRRPR